MNKFLAVLKDSYREARDGWIVYVMLGLMGIILLITLSLSFEPGPAPQAFESMVQQFKVVFPDRGKSKLPADSSSVNYTVKDVRDSGPGQYVMKLEVTGLTGNSLTNALKFLGADGNGSDGFRIAVVNWMRPPGPKRDFSFARNLGAGFQVATMQPVSADDQKAVTDEQMIEFLANQFKISGGLQNVEIQRIRDGIKEPTYLFNVDVKTGSGVRGWPHTTKIFFGTVTVTEKSPLGVVLWFIEEKIVNGFGAGIALLISVVITALFIPNMLRKGALDLLITKPIGRNTLLLYKYIGGLTFIFLMSVICVGGMWAVVGLRSGFWNTNFLLLIPLLTFTFAILYAFSTLVAVLTRSGTAAITLTIAFAFFLYIVGTIKNVIDDDMADPLRAESYPRWVAPTVNTIHDILPRYKDLDRLSTKLISDPLLTPLEEFALAKAKAGYPDWAPTIGVSLAFIAVMLGLACWRFNTRDG